MGVRSQSYFPHIFSCFRHDDFTREEQVLLPLHYLVKNTLCISQALSLPFIEVNLPHAINGCHNRAICRSHVSHWSVVYNRAYSYSYSSLVWVFIILDYILGGGNSFNLSLQSQLSCMLDGFHRTEDTFYLALILTTFNIKVLCKTATHTSTKSLSNADSWLLEIDTALIYIHMHTNNSEIEETLGRNQK